jgi:hypothetical protein
LGCPVRSLKYVERNQYGEKKILSENANIEKTSYTAKISSDVAFGQ